MKVRLPLSLLFALASVSGYAADTNSSYTNSSMLGPVLPTSVYNDSLLRKQWQWFPSKNGVNIAPVWASGITGSGSSGAWQAFKKVSNLPETTVVIGVIDAWVEPNHEDLKVALYWKDKVSEDDSPYYSESGLSRDFIDNEALPADNPETKDVNEAKGQIYTAESHGTFVAGMAAAIGGNKRGVVGAAPGATIAGLHVGYVSGGKEYMDPSAVNNAAWWQSGVGESGNSLVYSGEAAIQVKNCSFGSFWNANRDINKSFANSIASTSKNNVIYVFAAGNSRGEEVVPAPGSTGWSTYGNSRSIINVAATNKAGTYTDFSSFGSNVFISAPGEAVVSTDRSGEFGYNAGSLSSSITEEESTTTSRISNSNYADGDGTSFASPLVAGVVALGKEICPVMDVRWAKHALAYSSGYGEKPNIDTEKDETGNWVQKSGYTITEEDGGTLSSFEIKPDSGVIPAVSDESSPSNVGISTGDWQKNQGGYWFNNNYGFGLIEPEAFVNTVRDIAYTTVETEARGSLLMNAKASQEKRGLERTLEYAVGVTRSGGDGVTEESVLTQNVESVSVTVNFSDAALANENFNIGSLKVTLTDPYGVSSVLVQKCSADPTFLVGEEAADILGSYTFLSNAFWGSSYRGKLDDWTISVEYVLLDEAVDVDSTGWVSVSAVDFTMGEFVSETSSGGVAAGRTVNAHALVLDKSDSSFTVSGEFCVEDAVYVNGGVFEIKTGGQVGAYEDAALKKGAVYVQTGGRSVVDGIGTFSRGVHLYGGNLFLSEKGVLTGGKIFVAGGSLDISCGESNLSPTFGDIELSGGVVNLGERVRFTSAVTLKGGHLQVADRVSGGTLNVNGGLATIVKDAKFGSVFVGGNESVSGSLVVESKGTLTATGTLRFAGSGYGTVKSSAELVADTVDVGGNAKLDLVSGAGIDGSLSVADTGTVQWSGNVGISGDVAVNGGTLAAVGNAELRFTGKKSEYRDENDVATPRVFVGSGGTFEVGGKTTLYGASVSLNAGATLKLRSRTNSDYDLLVLKEYNTSDNTKLTPSLSFANPSQSEKGVVINYDFGDAIPYSAPLIELWGEGTFVNNDNVGFNVQIQNAPEVYIENAQGDFDTKVLTFDVDFETIDGDNPEKKFTRFFLSSKEGFDVEKQRLYYKQASALQKTVQKSLLKNEALAQSFLNELNRLNHVSELLGAYDALGTPTNVIAVDELHDKQVSAITGAISRRARELRSGFIRADVFSNPLLAYSGFTFSARPNQVAAKGFVPYAVAEEDYPLMVWMNGGYSFSEADDAAMSVSATKSNMLNVAMGVDYEVSKGLTLGLFAGYTNGRTKFDRGDRTEIQSRNLGVYISGADIDSDGTFYYTLAAAFGFEDYDFERKLSVGEGTFRSTASPDGWQGIAFIEGGYEWKMDKFSTGPALSLRYVANNIDGYTESSSEAWMRQEVDDVKYDSLQSSIGWRLSYRADFETATILPELRVSWNHEFLGTDENFDARLAMPNSGTYSCKITNTGDNYMTAGAGVSVMLGDVSTVSFDYDMQFLRDDADPTHSFNVMFRTRF